VIDKLVFIYWMSSWVKPIITISSKPKQKQ